MITRHGRPIAAIVPEVNRQQAKIDEVAEGIRSLRRRTATKVAGLGVVHLDVSVSACWAFADEVHPAADAAFSRIQTADAVVPALWWSRSAIFSSLTNVGGELAARLAGVPLVGAGARNCAPGKAVRAAAPVDQVTRPSSAYLSNGSEKQSNSMEPPSPVTNRENISENY
jgi:hypothetical protein